MLTKNKTKQNKTKTEQKTKQKKQKKKNKKQNKRKTDSDDDFRPVVKTSVNVTTNSPSQDCIHPHDHIMTGLLGSNRLQKNKNKTQKRET